MMKPVYESVLEVAEDGLHIPGGLIAEFGLKPGSRVVLDASGACVRVRPECPDEEHIARVALDYLTHNVGDAVAVRRPSRLPDGKWRVSVVLGYEDREIGVLMFSHHGTLIRDGSDGRQEMLTRALLPQS
ncbi:MAG: hypothetical protein HY318_09420 [Armatimonadetes bacterium]|nr:hypothetical protein [Armatimonadota bacterium]